MSAQGSLAGFRVVDLTQGLCGPFCSMQLGDAGAEVIKIEPPGGDYARRMGPPFVGGESAVFLSLNRNKKSVVLDYRNAAGRELIARLAATADVFLEDLARARRRNSASATTISSAKIRGSSIAR